MCMFFNKFSTEAGAIKMVWLKPELKSPNGGEGWVQSKRTGYLHGCNDEPPVDDELCEAGWPLVAVPPVDQQQPTNVGELDINVAYLTTP